MSSAIPTKQIDGDVAVGRNVTMGGKVTVRGSATIGHNLKVEGWLDAKNIKSANKGLFTTVAALRNAFPRPHDGWFAFVGDTFPAAIYIGDGGEWVATGKTGGPTTDLTDVNQTLEAHGDSIDELKQAVWPLEVTLTLTPAVIEVGATTSVRAAWTVRRNGENVLPQTGLRFFDGTDTSLLVNGTGSKTFSLSPTAPGVTTCKLTTSYGQMSKEISASVTAVYPSYSGKVGADTVVTADVVTGLTKVLNASKAMTPAQQTLSNQRLCYAYPKSFGTLTSVRDGNNFETLTAYTRTELTIGGVAYYVYTMTTPVTAENIKQIYI